MKILSSLWLATTLLISTLHLNASTHVTLSHNRDETTSTITLTLDLKSDEFVYKDYLDVSIDHPDVVLSSLETTSDPVSHYDNTFKETKKIFKDTVSVTVKATRNRPGITEANLHFSYYLTSNKAITEEILPITFTKPSAFSKPTESDLNYAVEVENVEVSEMVSATPPPTACAQDNKKQLMESISSHISTLAQTTESWWLRIIFVFILGMLLSLTPCIYPMIPITVGILQSRGKQSLLSNFITSFTYVAGIATTFALLGLMAAFTGQMFGSFMANPVVILVIVVLLIYLALSMFGLYEMYIPRSLQSNTQSVKQGSLLSIFLFGAVSGSVASPCLSPGLVLLLSIVTTLGNKCMGFFLLFAFGLGLGLPLLIIGTFSSSLTMLPRAGMWMVEIKKLFGFIMLAMCFYFIQPLIAPYILMWCIMLFMLIAGIWYVYDAQKTTQKSWRIIKNILGMGLIASSILVAAQAYKVMNICATEHNNAAWHTDYEHALALAKKDGKKLFIDIGAPICTLCKAIDNTVFTNPRVLTTLEQCIAVKIDGSDASNPVCALLQKQHNVVGFPTYLLIDPATDTLVKRWGSELYETPHESFIEELHNHFDA